jgi:hypothetical protein
LPTSTTCKKRWREPGRDQVSPSWAGDHEGCPWRYLRGSSWPAS